MMVTFADESDPTSMELIDADNLAAQYGEGSDLKRVTVEPTDDPVAIGIEKRLGWLRYAYPGMLNGDRFQDFRKTEFFSQISTGAFSTELNK